MNKKRVALLGILSITFLVVSFTSVFHSNSYVSLYHDSIDGLIESQQDLLQIVKTSNLSSTVEREKIKQAIRESRSKLKAADFWLRYFEPVSYKQINGPLPVEWEVEVFEKFEAPYKREGAGLTLATIYLDEEQIEKDSLVELVELSLIASKIFLEDSIVNRMQSADHFFFCNRLYILNLSAIYTTGFECPETGQVIPELLAMLEATQGIYQHYNESFSDKPLSAEYLKLYGKMLDFVRHQPVDFERFNHYSFIRDYVNPLFTLNQEMIRTYRVISRSPVDYSLNKTSTSIFDKNLYDAQNEKGVFLRVNDPAVLAEIDRVGKLLFYDPILSGNNSRSCASCHIPTEYFTDNKQCTSLQFNRTDFLDRNSPSLINASYNHLLMLDGKHISLQNQVSGVISEPSEMGANPEEILKKVLSCKEYKKVFNYLLQYTPQLKEISIEHVNSAITIYYSKFSNYYSPFDQAMNQKEVLDSSVIAGFNLFMSKAQCATCHFVPQFNGVKPPYTNSEFEVIGVPEQKEYLTVSNDTGRFGIYPSSESHRAFRTGSLRNIEHTAPYMHNGVFFTLEDVVDFYNHGGGAGRGLPVDNQTLSSDSLDLTKAEELNLILFMKSLNENIPFEAPPASLPVSGNKALNTRRVGGDY